MTAKSKSAIFYQNNPESRKKKAAYDTKLNSKKEQIKKRTEANAKRAEATKKGKNIKGLDYDHATNRFVKSSVNRGRAGEGGRKKK